jgi:hypothetical protein
MAAAQDPIIIIVGGSAKIKLGVGNFHSSSKRDFDDPDAKIVRVVVRDAAGNVLDSYDFSDGKFRVEFYGEEMANGNNP